MARPQMRGQVVAINASRLIDLNDASAADLGLLPGIGPTLGQRIIEYRGMHGPFGSVDDLVRVPGIGAVTLDAVRPYVRAGDVSDDVAGVGGFGGGPGER